ncbi:MAG: hypothetical protein ACRDHE_09635, partial [Ktedonobacterales bacterium]
MAEQNDPPASPDQAPDAPSASPAAGESGPLFARVTRVHSYLDMLADEDEDEPHARGRGRLVIAAVCGVLLVAIVGAVLLLGASSRHGKPPLAGQTATVPSGPLSATVPEGMPSHFAFGLMSAPGDIGLMNDMRARNGAAWDLRYVALTGGVTGGHGWETQGSPAGAYALAYADESSANRYTPAFAYEELAQTAGSCTGCDARHADLRNLNDPGIMAAYFANWRLLMQRLGTFGRPALVIVEPGLWGYLQQAAYNQGNTASVIPAAVASSSDQDATGMPNTAQGFAWTLLHIRDRYAPNAILTLHFSNWSTGSDINSSPSVALDVTSVATRTAQFLNSAGLANTPNGVSTWDLLSNDVSGQDSGQGAVWWDTTNKVYPNFARYLQFVAAVSHATGRKVVLWQIPEGNQYFDTMNNSAHHTQDNRAQYLLGHVADFANAGVIAALFGTGGGGTTVDDAAGDGVTNPTPIISF